MKEGIPVNVNSGRGGVGANTKPLDIKLMTGNLSDREKKELADRIKAMSPEELAIVAENIPVQFCMARINQELARAAEFERSVKEACGMK